MLVLLSGGTGGPKLLQGLMRVMDASDIVVVVNTAEDSWLSHGFISPDVDTVVYTLADLVDDGVWHGRRDDTFYCHEELVRLGSDEFLRIGDKDRALHIWRGERLKQGSKLSEVTQVHCNKLGVGSRVLPMTDDPVTTNIKTSEGEMGLHEYWVKHRGEPVVESVGYHGIGKAHAAEGVLDVLEDCERIIIGPSNPVTSINPILGIRDIRRVIKKHRTKTISVSPIIGGSAFSGPAEKLMKAQGIKVSIEGITDIYKEYADHLVVDESETSPSEILGVKIHKHVIWLDSLERKTALADFILGLDL